MARYKHYNHDQQKLLPISFARQILPGTFEYTLSYIIDHELKLAAFDARFNNDDTGAPAYDPAILLKIVLYAYARGITSSRDIEQCCRENILFMALSADSQPHFTTIAHFISSMREEIEPLFLEALLICDEMGLIGKEMSAIDGCKLPSNASSRNGAAPKPNWPTRSIRCGARSATSCRSIAKKTAKISPRRVGKRKGNKPLPCAPKSRRSKPVSKTTTEPAPQIRTPR